MQQQQQQQQQQQAQVRIPLGLGMANDVMAYGGVGCNGSGMVQMMHPARMAAPTPMAAPTVGAEQSATYVDAAKKGKTVIKM